MGKEDQIIMVVKRVSLGSIFNGFIEHGAQDFISKILQGYEYIRRGDAEKDVSYKQPIGYAIIINPKTKKVYAYKRASDENYFDKRLHGKWSWGVGGHIEKCDEENPIEGGMLREIEEEVDLDGNIIGTKVLGYINDDNQYEEDTKENKVSVGRVHFGVLYLIETDAENIGPKDKESVRGEFMSLDGLERVLNSEDCVVESWSEFALEPLKRYFSK